MSLYDDIIKGCNRALRDDQVDAAFPLARAFTHALIRAGLGMEVAPMVAPYSAARVEDCPGRCRGCPHFTR